MSAQELDDLAWKYGSDKSPRLKHHYTGFYAGWLADRREQIRTVVEIGIGYPEVMVGSHYQIGASLYMWRDYLPQASIWGADINPACLFEAERIYTVLCDQSHPRQLQELLRMSGGQVDLWVDDGSHVPADQISTCLYVLPQLPASTLYVIEDVARPRMVGEALHRGGFQTELLEVHDRHHHDDRLLRVWR
jgi:hypothetical protein